ncbi:unnamed protein product, partial [Prorocentrum cordatum]
MAPHQEALPAPKRPRTAQQPAAPPAPAPAAPSAAAPSPPAPLAVEELLEMDSGAKEYVDNALLKFLSEKQALVAFKVPASVMLIPPLKISSAASGAHLTSFREVMQYDNLQLSFSTTGQYEAAGTVWMLDPLAADTSDIVSISQLDAAMANWTEERLLLSSDHPPSRRYSFDVPLPARVVNTKVAQRMTEGESTVLMATGVPMLAGHPLVMAWYGAMAEALSAGNSDRTFKLFEAALSVPIRLRLSPDPDACLLASLLFSETVFSTSAASGADAFWKLAEKVSRLTKYQKAVAENISLPKLTKVLTTYGITFKGNALTAAHAKALKSLTPFVGNHACAVAYSLAEAFCPELREPTLLMRLAQLCKARTAPSQADKDAAACDSMAFVLTPALTHVLFKKHDVIEYIMHEAAMIDKDMAPTVSMFRSPLAIVKHFSASGEKGLAAAFRRGESSDNTGLENMFAVPVAEYRDQQGREARAQALIDFAWAVWAGHFDEELQELAAQDLQGGAAAFLWHRYFTDSAKEMGVKYRALTAACAAGPISTGTAEGGASGVATGAPELAEADQEDLKKTKDLLLSLRRKSVSFAALPSVGGATGAEHSAAQLQKLWEEMRL